MEAETFQDQELQRRREEFALRYGPKICPKCRAEFYDRKPWCRICAMAHPLEYSVAFREAVLRRRAECLGAIGVPPAFRDCGLDTFDDARADHKALLGRLRAWAAGELKTGLYLHGEAGRGKTHLGVAVLLEVIARQISCAFVSSRELLIRCRESFVRRESIDGILESCLSDRVLMLDDLSERSTEFGRETLETLTDRAYGRRRPTLIVTSNLSLEDLSRKLEPRIADRLTELCEPVRVLGVSYRRRIAAARGRGVETSGKAPL